uniref:Zygote arrest 1 n=1 Tax=Zonotrichia albicollis TaxID=44394 RepID=A0A8D2N7F4_ZONAL
MVRGQGSRAPPRGYLRPLSGGCPGSGAMAEEAMASYLYTTYHPYSYRYPPPKGRGGAASDWRPRGSSSYYSGYGEAAAEYFDNYQREQLKAILSQVNPNLTPRLRKANTKEVGVQVNPRQDASVQCSLGRRTLLRRRPGSAAPQPREAQREQELGSPATTNTRAVRFPRTIAVYSPVASRRLTAFLEEPSPEPEWQPQQQDKVPAVEEEPAALREQRAAEAAAEAAAVRASWEKPPEVGAEPLEQRWAEPLGQRSAAPPEPATEASQEQLVEPSAQAGAAEPSALAEPSAQAGAAEPSAQAGAAEPAESPASPQKQQQASAGKIRLRFQVSVGRGGAERGRAGPGGAAPSNNIFPVSSWSRSTGTTTARPATSAGRAPTSGACRAPTRSISVSSAGPAKSPTTRTAWRTSPARAASRRGAPAP